MPDSVKKALCLNDYGNIEMCDDIDIFLTRGSGKPLSYSRIQTVLNAIKKAVKADPKMYADNIIRGLWNARLSDKNGGQKNIQSYLMAQFDKLFPKSAFQDKSCIKTIKQNIDRLPQLIVGSMYKRPVENQGEWFDRLVEEYKNALNNLKPDTEKYNFAKAVVDRLQEGVGNFNNYINEVLVSNQGALKALTPEEIDLANEEEYGRKLYADLNQRHMSNADEVVEILRGKLNFDDKQEAALNFFVLGFYNDFGQATTNTTNKEEVFKKDMLDLYKICIGGLATKDPNNSSELMSLMKGLFKGLVTPEKIKTDWQKSYAKNEAKKAIAKWQPISSLERLKEILNEDAHKQLTPKETGKKLFKDIWAITYSDFTFETKVNETVKVLNDFVSGILGEAAAKESEDAIIKLAMKFSSGKRGIIATTNTLADVRDGFELFAELIKPKQLDESSSAKWEGFTEQFKLYITEQYIKNPEDEGKSLSLKFDRTPRDAQAIQAFFERHFTRKFAMLTPIQLKELMTNAGLPTIAAKIAQGGEGFEEAKTKLQECFENIAKNTGAKKNEVYYTSIGQFKKFVDNIIDSNNVDAVGDKAFLDINTLLINEKNMQQDEKKLAVTVKLKDIATDLFGKNVARESKAEIAEIANELCEKSQTSNKNIDGFERLFDFFDKQQAALVDDTEKQVVSSKIKGLIKGFEKHIPLADAGDKVGWLVEKYGNTVKKASDLQTFMEWHFKSTFKSFDANELNQYLTQLPTITKDIISNKDDDEKFYGGKAKLKELFNDCAAKIQNESRRLAEMEVFENFLREISRDNLVD